MELNGLIPAKTKDFRVSFISMGEINHLKKWHAWPLYFGMLAQYIIWTNGVLGFIIFL